MPNPAGNYPGRQIFLGSTLEENPAFVYVVTGRSDPSKGRYASPYLSDQNAIRMRPIDPKEPFDQFRHYQAVMIDPETGLLVVSNSQAPVDAVSEHYKFVTDDEKLSDGFAQNMLSLIGPEYDSKDKPTSRIIGVSAPCSGSWMNILAITAEKGSAYSTVDTPSKHNALQPGTFRFVPTYSGNVDYKNFDALKLKLDQTLFKTQETEAEALVQAFYDLTDYTDDKYGDLRVCTIAGVRNGRGPQGDWQLKTKNRWNSLEEFQAYLRERGKE